MGSFDQKVVWITGASSGIGRAMALRMHRSGAKVILSARRLHELRNVAESFDSDENYLILPIDMTESDDFEKIVTDAFEKFHRVDLLFHAAGISQRSTAVETSMDVDRRIMEVNYFGIIALSKIVVARMISAGGGHIAVLSSLVGKFGYPQRSAYSASKHALHGFFESLSYELQNEQIDITLICPGPVRTNISRNALNAAGHATGEMDEMQEKGMSPEECVEKIIAGLVKKKKEIIIGSFKEKLGVRIKAWAPALFWKIAAKQNPRGEVKF